MTDKVQKIKEQANIDIYNLRMAQEQGIITEFERGMLEALEGIADFVDSLQEELSIPEIVDEHYWEMLGEEFISKDLEKVAQKAYPEDIHKQSIFIHGATYAYTHSKNTQLLDGRLEEAATKYAQDKYMAVQTFQAFKAGAKWQKEHLWKSADGDDLPEIDREVVVFTQDFPNDAGIMSVAIAHRPNPNGWDAKSIITEKVERYIPKTYGKGGWNIPNIMYWLDVELPKEIEL